MKTQQKDLALSDPSGYPDQLPSGSKRAHGPLGSLTLYFGEEPRSSEDEKKEESMKGAVPVPRLSCRRRYLKYM